MKVDNLIMRCLTRFQPFTELMALLFCIGVIINLYFASIINEQSLTHSITQICMVFVALAAIKMIFTQSFTYILLMLIAFLVITLITPDTTLSEQVDISVEKSALKPTQGITKYTPYFQENINLNPLHNTKQIG